MIKIAHYEVYIDKGAGWQLEDRFAAEQRQEAFGLAKEKEAENLKVKIIKEIFDVQDNSYQESVEYVSNLGGIKKSGHKNNWASVADEEENSAELPEVKTMLSRTSIPGAIIKLVLLIMISLVFANLFVSLLFPILEKFIPEENSRPVLFGIFFIVFLAMSVPLLLKSLPWYIFIEKQKQSPEIKEQKFYTKAENLIQAYNINSNKEPIMATAYPEAPLEYKQYVISFLSEIISHIEEQNALQNRFLRMGIKLMIFGGCLELARYSGLKMSEANSMLYGALKIIDGDKADLEAFYEAKKTYADNKIAILLTGVGANLMSQVISGLPISENLLNVAYKKWAAQDKEPKFESHQTETKSNEAEDVLPSADIVKTCLVSLKSDLKFMDNSITNQEQTATSISEQIRNIVHNLQNKYSGTNVIEYGGITTIMFSKINKAFTFAEECLKDIASYQEELGNESLLMRNCIAITAYKPNEEPNLSNYLNDMFEHIYNNEIVINKEIKDALKSDSYKLDFLGEKPFKSFDRTEELYKLLNQ